MIIQLCNELKEKPSQIKILSKIMEELLNKNTTLHQKIPHHAAITEIFTNYLSKINPKKQAATYTYISASCEKYIQILLALASEDPGTVFPAITHCIASSPIKQIGINVMCSEICRKSKIDWSFLQDCACLRLIFNQLHATVMEVSKNGSQKYYEEILMFLFQIDHISGLTFEDSDAENREFKSSFQRIIVECLSQLEGTEQLDIKIYHKLGDKVFSKLSSPLILAQFLLSKFSKDEENPALQIQVLSCLFILVGKYGLEMQKFYESLENMISKKRAFSESLFKLKNSKRFLKLVESALRSSRVPFQNILSLTKLIIKNIFREESQFCFWALSFFVNLVKKHRQLQNHLSQFPEIELLKHHYSSRIRSLVAELDKNLNKSEYLEIEQFGRVNCRKLCEQKLEEISSKMQVNEEQVQFKIGKFYDFL